MVLRIERNPANTIMMNFGVALYFYRVGAQLEITTNVDRISGQGWRKSSHITDTVSLLWGEYCWRTKYLFRRPKSGKDSQLLVDHPIRRIFCP